MVLECLWISNLKIYPKLAGFFKSKWSSYSILLPGMVGFQIFCRHRHRFLNSILPGFGPFGI